MFLYIVPGMGPGMAADITRISDADLFAQDRRRNPAIGCLFQPIISRGSAMTLLQKERQSLSAYLRFGTFKVSGFEDEMTCIGAATTA